MRQISGHEVLEALSRGLGGRPVVEVLFDPPTAQPSTERAVRWWDELGQAAPWLFEWVTVAGRMYRGAPRFAQIVGAGHGYVVCSDEAEVAEILATTVGDDGPTERNPYSGPCRVTIATSTGESNT